MKNVIANIALLTNYTDNQIMDQIKKHFGYFIEISPKSIIDLYDIITSTDILINKKCNGNPDLVTSIIDEYKNTFLAFIGYEDQGNAKHWYTNVLDGDYVNAYRNGCFDPKVERTNIKETTDFLVDYFNSKNSSQIGNIEIGRLVVFSRWINLIESYQINKTEYSENIQKFSEYIKNENAALCKQCQEWLVDAYHIQRDPHYLYDTFRIRYHSDDYSNSIITDKLVYVDDRYTVDYYDQDNNQLDCYPVKCNCFMLT